MKAVTRQMVCAATRSANVVRRTTRLALAALLLTAAGALSGNPEPLPATAVSSPAEAVASLRSEVRLRKLHLVRPDLIQYPLAYEVIC